MRQRQTHSRYDELYKYFSLAALRLSAWLLGHIEKDQPLVIFGNGRANPHVADDGGHDARRKLLRNGMTAPAIRMKAVLAFDAHGIGIGRLHHRCCAGLFLARVRSREQRSSKCERA